MLENRAKGTYLPYGNMVTKILEETWYNFEEEREFKEGTTVIGTFILPSMHHYLKDENIIERTPLNKKKMNVISQKIPIEIESSDDSTMILITRDFPKILSGKIEVINGKINFIVHHFIPD